MGSEWVDVDQLQTGDTVRIDGELLENITQEQIKEIQLEYTEIELLY